MLLMLLLRGTPKVQWTPEKHPIFSRNVDDTVCLKTHPWDAFFYTGV